MGRVEKGYAQDALAFQALSDENRLKILDLLLNGETCASALLEGLSISQPTLSHHMKLLCEAEIVVSRRQGKQTIYRVNPKGISRAKIFIDRLTEGAPVQAAVSESAAKGTRVRPEGERPARRSNQGKPSPRPAKREMESYLL